MERVRNQEHVPGNWSSLVYIQVPLTAHLQQQTPLPSGFQPMDLLPHVEAASQPSQPSCLHLSLSRNVYLKDHQRGLFRDKLDAALRRARLSVPSHAKISSIAVFRNDEQNRRFLSWLVADEEAWLPALTKVIDGVLRDFALPAFYHPPAFHISFAWSTAAADPLPVPPATLPHPATIELGRLVLKCGNMQFILQ